MKPNGFAKGWPNVYSLSIGLFLLWTHLSFVDLPQHKVLKVFYLIVGWFACEWHKVPSIDESIMWSSMLGKCFQIQKKKCLGVFYNYIKVTLQIWSHIFKHPNLVNTMTTTNPKLQDIGQQKREKKEGV